MSEDQLFATLDPTTASLVREDGEEMLFYGYGWVYSNNYRII